MTPYDILGVSPTATPDEIKAAYKAKAKRAHPDAGGDKAAFQDLNDAYELLADPERRKRFDESGDTTPPNINDPDQAAWQIIAQLIEALLASEQDNTDLDVATGMRNGIDNALRQIDGNIQKVVRVQKRIEKMKKRFRRRAQDGHDMLMGMLDHRATMAAKMMEDMQAERQRNQRAKQLLDLYDYDFPAPPRNAFFGVPPSSAASTSYGY